MMRFFPESGTKFEAHSRGPCRSAEGGLAVASACPSSGDVAGAGFLWKGKNPRTVDSATVGVTAVHYSSSEWIKRLRVRGVCNTHCVNPSLYPKGNKLFGNLVVFFSESVP